MNESVIKWTTQYYNSIAIFRVKWWMFKCLKSLRHNESMKWWWRLSSTSCSVQFLCSPYHCDWLTHSLTSPFSLELKLYHQTIICLSGLVLCSCHLYIFFAHINLQFQPCFFQNFFSRFFFQILITNFKIFL